MGREGLLSELEDGNEGRRVNGVNLEGARLNFDAILHQQRWTRYKVQNVRNSLDELT